MACGCKYVHVVLMVVMRIAVGGHMVYYIFFAYFSGCAAMAVRRFMLHFEPNSAPQYGKPPSTLHKHIILGVAIAQIPLCWLLTPSRPAVVVTTITTTILSG